MKWVAVERGPPLTVSETNILEMDIARNGDGVLAVPAGLDLFVDNFENAFTRGAPGLHKLIELMQFADWFIQETSEHKKSDEIPQWHSPVQHALGAYRDDQHHTERADQIHRRIIECPNPHHDKRGVPQLVAHAIETRVFLI